MMIKTDVSVLYKTKLCKKYSTNGYCPYGMRCQFIHEVSEAQAPEVVPQQPAYVKLTTEPKPEMNVNSVAFTQKKTAGGFGHKQASLAIAETKIIYRDILAHCINVSVQEYQKKMKMF